MPTYTAPGVYVEETPPLARPVAGVGTSTAALIGVVPEDTQMPLIPGNSESYPLAAAGEPVLVTSWEEFKNNFGDFQAGNQTLAHAVYGFFNNGGTRCWVVRVAAATDLVDDLSAVFDKLAAIDEIAIVAVPGAVQEAQHTALINYCASLQDRVAILDGAITTTGTDTTEVDVPPSDIEIIRPAGLSPEGSYAALYYPWIEVYDPVSQQNIVQPPSGHLAGIYARNDATRGVFKAPANESVRGALGLSRRLSRSQQGGLNDAMINAIRNFNGAIKVWGARTLADTSAAEFRYISTRRYFNFLRESLDEGLQFVVFEPNTPDLWQRIKRTVGDFLLVQWQSGALFGETPQKAFFVKCDADTNPPVVRELGQVVTEIGVAIAKPAEFVIFRIQQITGS